MTDHRLVAHVPTLLEGLGTVRIEGQRLPPSYVEQLAALVLSNLREQLDGDMVEELAQLVSPIIFDGVEDVEVGPATRSVRRKVREDVRHSVEGFLTAIETRCRR